MGGREGLRVKIRGALLELEALSLGIEGKHVLWLGLADSASDRHGAERLATLIARAEDQRARVERHRLAAARAVISSGD